MTQSMGKQRLADIFADIDSQWMASGRKPQRLLLRCVVPGVRGSHRNFGLQLKRSVIQVGVVFSIQSTSVLPILLHHADGYDDGVPQLFPLAPLLVVASMLLLPSGTIPAM